jgi:hypothetical protein
MQRFGTAAFLAVFGGFLSACGASGGAWASAQDIAAPVAAMKRPGFLGAFFRPQGRPPFGVFSANPTPRAPEPYPAPTTNLFGSNGYCDAVAANGVSISTGYVVDAAKLANIIDLGVRWTRTPASPFFDDVSHIFTPGTYRFGDFDSAQCALLRQKIVPLIAIEAGPVQYNQSADRFSPKAVNRYKTAGEFGQWCSVVAAHERRIFTAVHRYSLPGNEVNTNTALFPGGEPEIAAYSQACYRAVKSADPHAFVYGFELNMDGRADAPRFVQRMHDLDCKVGTCYDGLSMHLSLRFPIPGPATPCFPNPGGDYSMRCVADVRKAAEAPVHIIMGETGYFVPGSVPDEATKARATLAEFEAFTQDPLIDGANYANVDECDQYPRGYFAGGCLINSVGTKLPAYTALRGLAKTAF